MPEPPEVWIFFGLIASGKSYLAAAWAARHGFTHLNSDQIRKELAGAAAVSGRGAAPNQGIYTPEFSRRTYDELLRQAALALTAGHSVLLDASYQSRAERDLLRSWAAGQAVRLHFVQCICPEEEVKRRLDLRVVDPAAVSDGNWEILQIQKKRFDPPTELAGAQLLNLATNQPVEVLLAELDKLLEVTSHV